MREGLHVPILTPDQRVRVFVSSTLRELEQERSAIRQAILDLRLHPVMFELGARSYPPAEVYRSYLRQSHIFIGVYWNSYGWVAPGMEVSGLEDEYNLSASLPRLIYVKAATEERTLKLAQLLTRIEEEGSVCYRSFTTATELVELVKNDIMLLLSERFSLELQSSTEPPPSYLNALAEIMTTSCLIERSAVVDEIEGTLVHNDRIALVGDPGIGKTFLLGAVGLRQNAIYISLNNKTAQQVLSYYANHLSLRRGQILVALPSEDDARAAFQQELAKNACILIADDADQNPEVAHILLSFHMYRCKVIFGVRSLQSDTLAGVKEYHVGAFSYAETVTYLSANGIVLPPGQAIDLHRKSGGNALYLFYFTQQQIQPLPESLDEYELSLWVRLNVHEKEGLNYIALSLFAVTVGDIHWLLNSRTVVTGTPMATKHIVEALKPIVRELDGVYQVFHPHFEEFVRDQIERDGLVNYYHSILGEYGLHRQRPLDAAFHFTRAGDSRAKEYRAEGARIAAVQGQLQLAQELLQGDLREASSPTEQANAQFALGHVYWEMGRFHDAKAAIIVSRDLYAQEGMADQQHLAELWRSLLLIEEGQADQAIEALTTARTLYGAHDDHVGAVLSVNLAYAYLQVSRLPESVEMSKHALDVFTRVNDEYGVTACLTNLAAALGQLGDRQTQRKYAEEVIDRAEQTGNRRLKAAGLNLLGGALRNLDDLEGAERALSECIAISQELGNMDLELLNICNLGNVFRDARDYARANAAYSEALSRSRSEGLPRHEARALELLGRVAYEQKAYAKAVELGSLAVETHRQFGDHLRIASTLSDLAKSYRGLGQIREAAQSFQDAAHHYIVTGLLDDVANAYRKAAVAWEAVHELANATDCMKNSLRYALDSGNAELVADSLVDLPAHYSGSDIDSTFLKGIAMYAQQPDSPGLVGLAYDFSAYCQRTQQPELLSEALTCLLPSQHPRLMTAVCVMIEQSINLLSSTQRSSVLTAWARANDHMHIRTMPDNTTIWTLGLQWESPLVVQVNVLSDTPLVHALAAAIAGVLIGNQAYIGASVAARGGNKEVGLAFYVVSEQEAREHLHVHVDKPSDRDDVPVSFSTSRVPWEENQPPTLIIVHENYAEVCAWSSNPGNKAFVWLLMNLFMIVGVHCTHGSRTPELAKASREFCEHALQS